MEEARIYTCGSSNSVRNRLFKKDDAMFIKIDGTKVSGKGEICNIDGKNGYTGDYSFNLQEISDIKEEEYMGFSALSFVAQEKGLYGSKKLKIFLPQLKQLNEVRNLLKELKGGPKETTAEAIASAVTRTANQPRPVEAPQPGRPAPVQQPADQPRPANQPRPVEAPQPGRPAPVQQPTDQPRPANQPRPVENPQPGRPAPIQQPTPQPAPIQQPTPQPASVQQPTPQPAPVQQPVVESKPVVQKPEISEEEFQKRMDKLAVLKDCGLLGEKEFVSKRLELVSEFCDLKDFNDKIQKLIALKDCGLLSDKEFEANRIDVIKECCDLDVSDINEYRKNVQKLSFLQIGEVITEEEYEKSKVSLVSDVEFNMSDDKDTFVRKLRRLPVLKDCRLIEEAGYEEKVKNLLEEIKVTKNDSKESLVNKLKKWPVLAQEKYISEMELATMQNELISSSLDMPWKTPDELKAIISRMGSLKEGECLTGADYEIRRSKLLAEIDAVPEYTTRVAMYRMLPQVGFISETEYESLKQKCIDEIFVSSHSVEEFKVRANNLVELQKVGMLTEDEFNAYKTKLMSEL